MAISTLTAPIAAKKERIYAPTGTIGRVLMRAQRLQDQIALLERELKKDRAYLLQHMQKNELDCIFCGDFRAQAKTRHNWAYSPATEREMLKVEVMKRRDKAEGLAVDSPTPYVSLSTIPTVA